MPNNDNTPVILKLTGLQDGTGNTTITVNPTAGSAANVSVETSGENKVVTISGLTTTTISDPVSVYIDAEGYKDESLKAERIVNQFGVTGTDLGFNPKIVTGGDDLSNLPVEFTFTVPVHYDNMEVNVTLDGLLPADDDPNGLREVEGRSAIKTFAFKPTAAGKYTLKLKTINKEACVCSLTLESEKYYYETETLNIEQKVQTSVTYSGNINVTETLTFNSPLQTNNNRYNNNASVTIKVDGASHIESGNLSYSIERDTETTGNWWNPTTSYYITGLSEFTIQNVSITGDNINENTNVTITITVTSDRQQSGSRPVTYTNTIGELGLTR